MGPVGLTPGHGLMVTHIQGSSHLLEFKQLGFIGVLGKSSSQSALKDVFLSLQLLNVLGHVIVFIQSIIELFNVVAVLVHVVIQIFVIFMR